VPGRFYRPQLKPAPDAKDPNFEFEVEEILDTRGTGRRKEYLVKYMFYPAKFNQWIPATNMVQKS